MQKLLTKLLVCIALITLLITEIASAQLPTVTSVNPMAANPGATVTLTGTNFNTTPANNIVYFGATRATVTAASTTTLTATVPSGATYNHISVNNTASALTGYSQYPFIPTCDNSIVYPGPINFASQVAIATGTNPRVVAIGDIDGDGKPDLAMTNGIPNTVSVYRNTSSSGSITSGSLATGVTFATGSNPSHVVLGDLDGDGKLDMVVSNYNSASISVYRNISSSGSITSGSFAAQVTFATGTNPEGLAIGDIDGDGKPEIAVTSRLSSTIAVFRNTSASGSITSGSFATPVTFATGTSNFSVAISDIDGDGKPDLAVVNTGSSTVSVLRNTSTTGSITSGSFATQVTFAIGSGARTLAIGDIDGDGKPDLAVAHITSNYISVLRNTSTSGSITSGSFATQVTFTAGTQPFGLAIGDIDGDGKPDLAVTNNGSANVSVLRNTSTSGSIASGSFATPVTFATGSGPWGVVIGDLDDDGFPDLAVANQTASTFSLIRNNPTLLTKVTSVNPIAANPGTTVTLTGINFNTTPANNIVYFGATRATVTASGTTTLTATVPVGATYKEVSVNNTATALTGYSQYPFIPTFDNSAVSPLSINFASPVAFAAGTNPRGSAIGDLDGDGKPDMVVANAAASTVLVYRNTSSSGSISSGSFAAAVTFAVGTAPISVGIGDVDGDGKPDLVVSNTGSNNISVLRNTSTSGSITSGSFATHVTFATGTNPRYLAIGDIDGDGKLDIAVPNYSSNTVSVLRNTSNSGSITSGSFATQVTFSAGTQPFAVAIGDIEGDGKPDMAVTNYSSNTVSVYRNTSSSGAITSASFDAQVTFATGTAPAGVTMGDIDGDGKLDMTVANNGTTTVSVYRNTSTSGSITSGSFATQVTFATGDNPSFIAVGDINGDGKPDMAVSNSNSNTVSVYSNTSSSGSITSGSFATPVTFATGNNPQSIAIGDMDGDNLPDIVVVNNGSNTASVLRNSPTFLPTTVTSVNPTSATPGATVTLTGTIFSTTPANNIVYFGATRATVTAAGTTTLTATVPVGATYNNVSVNNAMSKLTGYSQYPFMPTFNNSAYVPATVNFNSQQTFAAGTQPRGTAIGDIDGDGKSDIVVVNGGANTVSVYRNTSTSGSITSGSFATQVTFATGNTPYGVRLGDLDGDGKLDMVVTNFVGGSISVYRNTSTSGSITTGSFAAPISFSTGTGPNTLAIGDIDGDGKPEIAVTNSTSGTVSVFRNTSTSGSITSGSFATHVTFATGGSPIGVTISDIDGDGKPDMAVANQSSATVSVYHNTSSSGSITSGSFASQVTFAIGTGARTLAIGDIDGDGKADIAVTNSGSNNISILRNTSTSGGITSGSFATQVTFTTDNFPFGMAIGDIDGDGKPDLAVTTNGTNAVSIYRNTGSSGSITSGSFATPVTFATSNSPWGVAIGDLDGDGLPDLAVTNNGTNNVSVIRNNPLRPITGAAQVCVGSTITLANATSGGSWSSSNAAVATVGSLTGVVTGLSGGTVTITYAGSAGATFADNRVTTIVTVIAAPSVTSVSPNAANPGAAVTITGTGFNATAGNNIVYFGATRAMVTAASTTSLTATLPIGATYKQVSVMNTICPLTGFTQYPFLPTFDNSATTPSTISMASQVTFATGANPRGSAIGDLDGDGKPDLVVTNTGSGTVSVYRNTSSSGSITSGSFATAVTFAVGAIPVGVSIGDIDGDGKPDLVVSNGNSASISVLRNTSTSGSITSGSFATHVTFATGTAPHTLALGDIDGDGKLDVAVPNYSSATVSVLRNTSTSGSITSGSFATQVTFATGTNPFNVAIGDIDGDGKPDMVVANAATGVNTVSVYRNTSSSGSITSGSFASPVTFATAANAYGVALGDLDGDGKPDMAVSTNGSVSVFRNTSSSGSITSGSFASGVTFATGSSCVYIAMGDINGDSKPDIVTANYNTNTISVLRNTSSSGSITSGSFATQVTYAAGTNPYSVAIGDLDGDGLPDIISPNYGSNTVSVFRNSPTFLPTTVTSVNPTTANPGATVTLTGTRFSATPANNIVYFGATRATVTAASTTTLTATVPLGATYDRVSVNNVISKLTGYSQYPFLPKYDNSAFVPGTVNMDGKVDFTTGSVPRSVAIGDLDGDGKADLAVANDGSSTVSVFRNTSSSGAITAGSFAAKVDFTTGTNPNSVAIGDLDGDGKADLAVVNFNSNTVSVFRNTSSSGAITAGSFAAKVDFTTGTAPVGVAIGDLDGDGKADLAVANFGSTNVSVFRNTSSSGAITAGSFAAKVDFTTGTGPQSVSIGDLDGDGKADLAVANRNSNTVSVFRNTSSSGAITAGSFAAKVDFTTGTNPRGVAIGDLDGDGKADLAVVNQNSATVSIFRNTSSSGAITAGSFAAKVDFTTGTQPWSVAIGDLDGDGKADLAVANMGSNTVSVIRNNPLHPITGTAQVCVGNTTTLSNATTGGTWSSSDAAVATVGTTSGVVTGVSGGTVTISYIGSASAIFADNIVTRVVTVNASPTVSAGADIALCTGSSTNLTATGAVDYTWSPGTGLSATTGATVSANPSSTITYTVTGSDGSGCSNTATKTVSVNALPTVSAGADVAICIGSSTNLTATGAVDYTWSPGAGLSATTGATVSANPSSTITYTVTGSDGSGCVNTATKTVSVNATLAVAAGGTVSICTGGSTNITATGAIDYTWSPATGLSATTGATVTANPLSTITYTVTGTDGTGCSNTATKTVSVNALPTVSAGADVAICIGGSTNLTATGAVDYTWSPGTGLSATTGATVSANPSSTITYTVTGSDGSGCVNTATKTVSVNATLAVAAGGTVSICTGGSTNITATGAIDYTWSPATGLSATTGATVTANPLSTITYTVTGTDGTGCSNTATKTVSVNALPTVSAGADVAICIGGSTNLTATGAVDYTWSPGTSLSATTGATVSASPTSTITYTVTGFDGSGCSNTATKTVSVNATLAVAAGGTVSICTGGSTNITATGAIDYTWSPATGLSATTGATVTANPSSTITYTVTGSDGSGCSNTATKTVSVNALPSVSAGTDVAICNGSSTNLTATGAVDYTWSPGTGLSATTGATVSANPSNTITYTVTGSDGSGCSNTATKTVSVNALPTVSAGSNVTICNGNSTNLTATGAVDYSWSPGTGLSATTGSTVSANPSSTITYTVTGTDGNGCINTATKTVSVNALPTVSVGTDVAICIGSSTNITATGAVDYLWSPATGLSATTGATVTANPSSTITYTVTGTDGNGCVNTASKTVSVNALPTVSAGSNVTICNGSSTNLTATGAVDYTWSPGTSLSAITGATVSANPSSTITYTVTGTDGNGCVNTASKTVSVNASSAVSAGSNIGICIGDSTEITATGAVEYTWSPATGLSATTGATVTANPSSTITYTVTGTIGGGCANTATKTVSVSATPASISSAPALCPTQTATLTTASSGGVWSSINPLVMSVDSTTGVITAVINNYSGVSYTIINYSLPSGCVTSRLVTVNPMPAPIYGGTSALCLGESTTLSSGSAGHTWSSSSPAVATITSGGVVNSVGAGTTTISYTNSSGCFTTKVVTVNGALPANTGTLSVCTGQTTTLSNATPAGTWTSSNNIVASVSMYTGVVSGLSAGTVNISYRIGSTCVSVSQVTVNSNAAAISGTQTVCIGTTTTLTYPVSGGTWSSATPGVATIDVNSGVVTGVGLGTSEITYTVAAGCFKTAVVTVTALPAAISGTAVVCQGSATTLSSGTGTWSSSNISVATVNSLGTVAGVSAGNANITFRSAATGCYVTREVTVNPMPVIVSAAVCPTQTATLTATPSGGTWAISPSTIASVNAATGELTGIIANNTGFSIASVTYTSLLGCVNTAIVTVNPIPSVITGGVRNICTSGTTNLSSSTTGAVWSSSSPGVATISGVGLVTGVGAGTATISYTNASGCASTTIMTVNATPVVPAITGTLAVCRLATTNLSNATSGGVWSSSNNIIATVNSSGVVTGVNTGTARITYTLGSGCTAIATATVTVNQLPAVTAITGGLSLCANGTSTLSTISTGGVWSSSVPAVGSISTTGVVTGVTIGNTSISYTVTNSFGCVGRSTAVVTVNPTFTVGGITGTLSVCKGATTALSSVTGGGVWTSSTPAAGTVGVSGVVTGVNAGTTTISYTVTNGLGCVTRVTSVVTVNPLPVVTNATATYTTCENVNMTLNSNIASGTWSSSNPSVGTINTTTGVFTPVSVGSTMISYTVSSTGCVGARSVTTNAMPSSITGVSAICVGGTSTLSSSTTGGTWSSSNVAIATVNVTTGVVTASNAGTTTLSYRGANGCSAVRLVTVNLTPAVIAGTSTVCVGSTTTLGTTPTGGVWSSSNASIATVGTSTGVVSGVLNGTATITYTTGAGCIRTTVVTVNALPAAITGVGVACAGGGTTALTNVTGTWSSSNASIASVSFLGVVTGGTAGTAIITFRNANSCAVTREVTINPQPAAFVTPTGLCAGSTGTLTATPSGGTWASSNPSIFTIDASSGVLTAVIVNTTGNSAGVATYTLPTGCSRTGVVTVNRQPSSIYGGSGLLCTGNTLAQLSSTTGCIWSSATPSVATISSTGVVTGVSAGNAVISYTNAAGCAAQRVITVNATPAPITGATSVTVGGTTTLANATTGGTWSSSTTSRATIGSASGVVTGVSIGATTITYMMPTGCFVTRAMNVAAARGVEGVISEVEVSEVRIYPNPTTGTFSIATETDGAISMYTIDGKEVLQHEVKAGTTSISMPAGIANGVYMLRFNGADGSSKIVRLVYQQ